MLQTWILREDIAPNLAVHSGADASICGNCPHRGRLEFVTRDGKTEQKNVERSCYVTVHQGPLSVWKAYKKGNYLDLTEQGDALERRGQSAARSYIGDGRAVRIGSYGDPAAVPVSVWWDLIWSAKTWTGYTHQWRTHPEFKSLVMASCDSFEESETARLDGWRTFRVKRELL